MAKLSYSVHHNAMDMPFTFAGWVKSKKDVDKLIAEVRKGSGLPRFVVIKEEKPGYAVGDKSSGWNQQPLTYSEFLAREAKEAAWRAEFSFSA